MAKTRAGWERKIYRGTAGSTASTQITPNVTDVNIGGGHTRASTTSRGSGSAIPKEHEQIVGINEQLSLSMNYDDGDAHMTALLNAHKNGTPLAFKVEDVVSGAYATVFDGDCTVTRDQPGPLSGGMIVTFTLTPTKESGRDFSYT